MEILFISPETLDSSFFLSVIENIAISFSVIDEVHCISEWSHNFRTSYLKVGSILKTIMKENYVVLGIIS